MLQGLWNAESMLVVNLDTIVSEVKREGVLGADGSGPGVDEG